MIRAVIAVLLAVALLAASQPAIERTRVAHAHSRIDGELTAVRTAVRDLLASDDPVPAGEPGARRHLTVRLPARSWASSAVERVVIGADHGDHDRLAWRIAGGRRGSIRLSVDLRRSDGDPLVLRRPGRHRLLLALIRSKGVPAILVRRLRFIPEEGSTRAHADARRADRPVRVYNGRRTGAIGSGRRRVPRAGAAG